MTDDNIDMFGPFAGSKMDMLMRHMALMAVWKLFQVEQMMKESQVDSRHGPMESDKDSFGAFMYWMHRVMREALDDEGIKYAESATEQTITVSETAWEKLHLQADMATWVNSIIPDTNLPMKLKEEVQELLEAMQHPKIRHSEVDNTSEMEDELADVLLVLMVIAHRCHVDLLQVGVNKLEVNRKRKWEKQPGGTYHHVED